LGSPPYFGSDRRNRLANVGEFGNTGLSTLRSSRASLTRAYRVGLLGHAIVYGDSRRGRTEEVAILDLLSLTGK
jgi:hypothetical protein